MYKHAKILLKQGLGLVVDIILITAITVTGIEVIGIFVKDSDYYRDHRILFASENSIRPVGEDKWTYKPNSQILSAAIYQLSRFQGWIEYKCKIETNRFGLIDTNFNAESDGVDYLVLGDSFTEGQGGCPWLTRDALRKGNYPTILNGGLMGGGLQDFERIADWLTSQIKIKNLIVIAISNDFKRNLYNGEWVGHERCLNGGVCDEEWGDYWWGIKSQVSDDDLLKIALKRFEARNMSPTMQLKHTIKYYSLTYKVLHKFYNQIKTRATRIDWPAQAALFAPNFYALSRLKQKFPTMQLLLVPQRDEVGLLGKENMDSRIVKAFLARSGISYEFCELGMSDYMAIDGHPNRNGYEHIFSCLTRLF